MNDHVISFNPARRNGIVGLYGYSRGIRSDGRYKWEAIKDFIRVESQLAPQLFLVANLHLDPEAGVISRRIVSLEYLRSCEFYETHRELLECQEAHFERATAGATRRFNRESVQ